MTKARAWNVESSTGERRTAMADRERTRLLEHFAALRMHVAALARQVRSLGAEPVPMPKATLADAHDGAAYIAADMEARPVTAEDVGAWRRPATTRSREEVYASSTRARIESFLYARGGEHTPADIATALGVSIRAVRVALSKDGSGMFLKRKMPGDAVRVLYRLVEGLVAEG